MARQLRICFEGAWYHIMNRGINRGKIFFNDKQRDTFLNLLNETKKIYDIEIHAYCLMSNHYHLIIHTPRGNISNAMKYLNSCYATFVNKDMKRDGPLFKGRFKAIIISADEYLIQLSRYIHLNPLEAKMVQSLSMYKWSSYPSYIAKAVPPQWLSTDEIKSRFSQLNFRHAYKKFVESNSDKNLDDHFKKEKSAPILGSNDFRQMIDDYIRAHSLSAEIVGANHILVPPDIKTIVEAVSLYFNLDSKVVYKPSQGIKNYTRQIAIYICRSLGGYSLREIAKAMGEISYKGISNTICRVRSNADQLKIVEMLIMQLKHRSVTIGEIRGK